MIAAADRLRAQHEARSPSCRRRTSGSGSRSERARILAESGSSAPQPVDVSTQEKLLAVLNDAPLSCLEGPDRARTRPGEAGAREGRRDPRAEAVQFRVPAATLKTGADVDAYLERPAASGSCSTSTKATP